jgi:serine/threonine protein kinase
LEGSSESLKHGPSIKDYEVIRVISRGNFGQVYLAQKKKTGDVYAIKVLKKQEMLVKNQAHHVKTERDILAFVNNPYVVKLYFAFSSKVSSSLSLPFPFSLHNLL